MQNQTVSIIIAVVLLLTHGAATAAVPPLVSGEPIPVGAPDRRGPLSTGLSNSPLGSAFVYGGAQPDLFVPSSRFSHNRGLFLYRWLGTDETGAPIFGEPVHVKIPFDGAIPPAGVVYETHDGQIEALWLQKRSIVRSRFNREKLEFVKTADDPVEVKGLPQTPDRLAALVNGDGSLNVIFALDDGTPQRPTEPKSWRDPAWYGFDGAGAWRGGWPYAFLYAAMLPPSSAPPASSIDARRVTPTEREALLGYGSIATVNFGPGRERDVLTGSHFGNLLYYRNGSSTGVQLEARRLAVGADGIALRHPTIRPSPVAYPNPKTRLSDLIVGGEGHLYHYRFTGQFSDAGAPVFDAPASVLEQNADLYAGSLPVLNGVDWDGDGAQDLIAGNSTGMILFIRNLGSTAAPAFAPGVPLEAGGRIIHIQPGYWDIQGPQEARWGYASPTIYDWNGDGLPDLLLSDATARHTVFINRGTRDKPALEVGRPLYSDGLEVHGSWRVKPGVGNLGGRLAYVALDDQDEFHLYHRIDDFNAEDAGKLRLEDGRAIRANFLAAGGTGRSKINVIDWDRDGKTDLLVGTPRHGSIPDPKKGLPQSKGLKGAAVVFLRNVGSNDKPSFAFPTLMKFKGEPIYVGQHECGPAAVDFGAADGPNLVVGIEVGRVMYYKRSDLSWGPDDAER